MMLAVLSGLGIGILLGLAFHFGYPVEYSFYITMALLAALDSIFGAVKAQMNGEYNTLIFLSGFITNAILAALLAFLGDKLGIPLYYAAIVVFGGRLFNNIAAIRRILILRFFAKKNKKTDN